MARHRHQREKRLTRSSHTWSTTAATTMIAVWSVRFPYVSTRMMCSNPIYIVRTGLLGRDDSYNLTLSHVHPCK
jgi:hypothetical protein